MRAGIRVAVTPGIGPGIGFGWVSSSGSQRQTEAGGSALRTRASAPTTSRRPGGVAQQLGQRKPGTTGVYTEYDPGYLKAACATLDRLTQAIRPRKLPRRPRRRAGKNDEGKSCCRSSVVEHSLGKGEVESSIPSGSTTPLLCNHWARSPLEIFQRHARARLACGLGETAPVKPQTPQTVPLSPPADCPWPRTARRWACGCRRRTRPRAPRARV